MVWKKRPWGNALEKAPAQLRMLHTRRAAAHPTLDLQSLEAAQQTIRQKSEDVRGYLDDANDQTVGRLVRLRADYMPSVRKYDKM